MNSAISLSHSVLHFRVSFCYFFSVVHWCSRMRIHEIIPQAFFCFIICFSFFLSFFLFFFLSPHILFQFDSNAVFASFFLFFFFFFSFFVLFAFVNCAYIDKCWHSLVQPRECSNGWNYSKSINQGSLSIKKMVSSFSQCQERRNANSHYPYRDLSWTQVIENVRMTNNSYTCIYLCNTSATCKIWHKVGVSNSDFSFF